MGVMFLIAGTIALALAIITGFVVLQSVDEAEILEAASTVNVSEASGWINSTTYTLDNYDANAEGYTLNAAYNGTTVIASGNWTFTGGSASLINATADENWFDVTFHYTYKPESPFEVSVRGTEGNLTDGVDEIATRIPTILTIAAAVLLIGIIVLLIARSKLVQEPMNQGASL